MTRRPSDKKERLVRAAVALFHRDGLNGPSIADIARDADVPVGNVFYHFRTKDDLVRAVVGHWAARIDSAMGAVLPDGTPEERLTAFLDAAAERADIYAAIGCPLVALARNLRQSGRLLSPLAATVIRPQLDWIGAMLGAIGLRKDEAARAARTILATLQGSFQLAFALGDPDVIRATVEGLKTQIAALSRPTAFSLRAQPT